MSDTAFRDWQSVQQEVLRRIHTRMWKPGDLIPTEAELALEFGCARTTVNRALRSLADLGRLDRKRRAGTRIAAEPVAKAVLDISVIRMDVESRGQAYGYQRLSRVVAVPSTAISAAMRTGSQTSLLHLRALHLADNRPYALEDRWINTAVVPDAMHESFEAISGNEWLLRHAPYTHGDIAFSATSADKTEAAALDCPLGSAVFTIDRLTWDRDQSVTKVHLAFAPGHALRTQI